MTRRTEWVNSVLSGARKSPFSRVKTHWADLTYDDARAKGYITTEVKTGGVLRDLRVAKPPSDHLQEAEA